MWHIFMGRITALWHTAASLSCMFSCSPLGLSQSEGHHGDWWSAQWFDHKCTRDALPVTTLLICPSLGSTLSIVQRLRILCADPVSSLGIRDMVNASKVLPLDHGGSLSSINVLFKPTLCRSVILVWILPPLQIGKLSMQRTKNVFNNPVITYTLQNHEYDDKYS